jgi:hypothetical protein
VITAAGPVRTPSARAITTVRRREDPERTRDHRRPTSARAFADARGEEIEEVFLELR